MEKNFLDLVEKLKRDFPQFAFEKNSDSHWSPSEHKIYFRENPTELFHELGHALLDHKDFIQDIDLIKMERDAWSKGIKISKNYGYKISQSEVERALDGYRDWLHARSLCPNCGQTGIQDRTTLEYSCLNCGTKWSANDSRKVGLKRHVVYRPSTSL